MKATLAQPSKSSEAASETRPEPAKTPLLESIVAAIRNDASSDSLKFVLRSDTGHDGE